jgi:uncharacterized membrane protein
MASAPTASRGFSPALAVAALLTLALWPVEIQTAFGLPAHPLLLHVPVVFIPLLSVAALVFAVRPGLFSRSGALLAAFGVVTCAFTLLTAGAGEAFREDRERAEPALATDPAMADHADAGSALRFTIALLALALVGALFVRRGVASVVLRAVIFLLAVSALFFVVRVGHLGSELVWGD